MTTINKPMIDHKSLHSQPSVIFRLINHTRFYYPPKWALRQISDAIEWGLEASTSRGLVSMEVQSTPLRSREYLTCIDELGPGALHDLMGLLDWIKAENVFNFLGFTQDPSGSITVTHFGPLCHTREGNEIRDQALIIQDCCKKKLDANNEENMNKNQEGIETGEYFNSAELLSNISSLKTKRAVIARQLITARKGSKVASEALKVATEATVKATEDEKFKKMGEPDYEQKSSVGIMSGLDFSIWRALHSKWIESRSQISTSLELLIPGPTTMKSAGIDLEQLGQHVADEFRRKRADFMQSIIEIIGLNKDLIKVNNSIDDLHDKLDHHSIEMIVCKKSFAIITNIIEKIDYCLENKCSPKKMHLSIYCAPANEDQASQEVIQRVTSHIRSFRIMTHAHDIFDEGNILAIHKIIGNSNFADANVSIIEQCLVDAGYALGVAKTFIREARKIRQGLNSEDGESVSNASGASEIKDGHRKLPAKVDEGQREYKKQRTNV